MTRRLAALALALVGCLSEPHASQHDGGLDGPGDGGTGIAYRRVFFQTSFATTALQVPLSAAVAGDAVVFHMATPSFMPADYTISAPGWTITKLAPHTSAASFAAIAPDTSPVMFTFTSSLNDTTVILADEFTGNDPNATTAFDDHVENGGGGDCAAVMSLRRTGDALWAACTTASDVMVGPGFNVGAMDTGNVAEWKIATDAPGTVEMIRVPLQMPSNALYVITAVSIRPR